MQMDEMSGYFKKYWKDRHQIGAASAAEGSTASSSGPSARKPLRPAQQIRPTYTEERLSAKMAALAAIAGEVKGASASEQVDIDALKKTVLSQMHSKAFDERAVAQALKKALQNKDVKNKYAAAVRKDADLWSDIQEHLRDFRDSDKKPNPLASPRLKEVAANSLAAFLGPAGPLFILGHDLYREHKEDAKTILGKLGGLTSVGKATIASIRKNSGRMTFLYQKWGTRLRSGLNAVIGKFGSWASKLWDKLTGGKGFGRSGRAVAKGSRGVGRWLKNPRVLAGIAAAGLATGAFAGESEHGDEAVDQVPPVTPIASSTDPASDSATRDKSDGDKSMLDDAKAGVTAGVASLTAFFGTLGRDLLDGWKSIELNAQRVAVSITGIYDESMRKGHFVKDELENELGRLWDGVKDWAGDIWTKIKSLVPDGVAKAGSWVANGVKRLLGPSESAGKGGDGSGNITSLTMPVAKPAGAGRGSQGVPTSGADSVKLSSGVDVEGVNPTVMKNFYAMADEFYQSTGSRLQVNSGYRSAAKQAQLYAANPRNAAKPGASMHEFGYAIDINSSEAERLDSMGLLGKYGFTRPVSGEAWHLEPIAIQNQKAAIRAGTAQIDPPGAGAKNQTSSPETEGASNSVTPATDAQKASQGKYKASDNYGEDSVSSAAPTTASPTASSSAPEPVASAPVAPKADDGGYSRVSSRSKVIDTDVEPDVEPAAQQVASDSRGVVSVNSIPSYLGDMGMLNMNLGAA